MKHIKVLLVDDDPRILKTAKRYLMDFDLSIASSGNEAISMLKNNVVDVIVSDYNMADGNGLEFKEVVNKTDKRIPFILMSGQITKELSMQMANLHVYWIVEKPLIFDDLSEKIKEAYKDFEVNRHNDKLSLIGKNTGQIIHDLNNSLSIIQMSSEIGKELTQEEFSKKQFDRNLNSCKRIQSIIKKYREFINNRDKIVLKDFSIHDLAMEFKEEFEATFSNNKKIGFSLDSKINENVLIKLDADLIYQVLLNLMKNSLDAINVHKEPWIRVELTETLDKVFIKFKDSGKGIDKSLASVIFEEKQSTKGENGTGMGLSYCKKIMNFHLGDIWLDNNSENTTFVLEFIK